MPRIYDCFTFFNELDVLDIRLGELAEVVDQFVIVEATRSFTGKPKPLHFADNAARYGAYRDKIIHVVVDDMPLAAPDAWAREYFQRDAIARGLGGAAGDDIVMLSDADEIPRAAVIAEIRARAQARDAVIFLAQDQFCFRMNLRADNFTWLKGTRLIEKKHLRSPQDFRALRLRPYKKAYQSLIDPLRLRADIFRYCNRLLTPRVIPNAGWHFGYMGGNAAVRDKVQSFAHQELNQADLLTDAYINGRIASGQFFNDGLGMRLRAVPLDATFPAYLRVNSARYAAHLIAMPAQAEP